MAGRREAARAAGSVGIAVLISRLLGLVRELTIAAVFGASAVTDAWLVAFRVPGMLRDLVAEGSLSSAFIPTFNRVLAREGKQAAWTLANLVTSALLVLLGLITCLFFFFSDSFVYLFAFGFDPAGDKFELTSNLIRILSPFLLLVAVSSVLMGILNTFGFFFLPALTTAFFNVAVIGSALLLVPWLESQGIPGIYAIGFGALLGGGLQIAVQAPVLRRLGFRFGFRLQLNHPDLLHIGRLVGPAALGVGITQVTVMINTALASTLGDGPISWLNFAFRIIYLPIGLFGVSMGIVNLREVSAHAAEDNLQKLKETVANSLRMVIALSIPSSIGLIFLASPICAAIFQRGEFTAFDTSQTAGALVLYSLGLTSYSCVKIYVPTFYALNDSRSPVRVSILTACFHICFNLIVMFFIAPPGKEFLGLALATSVSLLVNQTMLAVKLRQRLGSFGGLGIGPALAKSLGASLVMAVVVCVGRLYLTPLAHGGVSRIGAVAACILAGSTAYFAAARVLGLEEVSFLLPGRRGGARP